MVTGSHEQLYQMLRSGWLDVVLNDLRRNPSDEYVNHALGHVPLLRSGKAVCRPYYMFWRGSNEKPYIGDFAALVKAQFPAEG